MRSHYHFDLTHKVTFVFLQQSWGWL